MSIERARDVSGLELKSIKGPGITSASPANGQFGEIAAKSGS